MRDATHTITRRPLFLASDELGNRNPKVLDSRRAQRQVVIINSAQFTRDPTMSMLLENPAVDRLAILVEEATRSTDEGVRFFVEPARGTLSRCTTKRHHLIFGRRGSGKTSLLKKAASDLTVSRRPIAFVDLEEFKGHSYPDVLISILLKSFKKFREWLETAAVYPANKRSWWRKFFGAEPKTPSFNREKTREISKLLSEHIETLQRLLDRADHHDCGSIRVHQWNFVCSRILRNGRHSDVGCRRNPLGDCPGRSATENRRPDCRTSDPGFCILPLNEGIDRALWTPS